MSVVVDINRVSDNTTQHENIHARLKTAAQNGDVKSLYRLVAKDPNILGCFDQLPICETPLHVAAERGQTHFAMELMILKPSFALKLNESGISPMHLALQNKHIEMVRGFVAIDSSLVSIKGIGRTTPLHHVAEIGDAELLSEFLFACPSSVEDLTVKRETVAHVAMKNNQIEALKVLLGWLRRANKEDILDWKDEDGNTVYHIAASKSQIEVMKLLRKTVKVRAKNLDGKTAMDVLRTHKSPIFTETSRFLRSTKERLFCGSTLTLVDYLKEKRSRIERWNNLLGIGNMNRSRHESTNNSDCRGVILVVAILIVTATYQAGLSPPGGFWQEDVMDQNNTSIIHRAGEMTMPVRIALFFYVFNEIAYFSSLYVILTFIIGLPRWKVLFGAIAALGIGKIATFLNTFPLSQTEVKEFAVFFFIFIAYPVALASIVIAPFLAFLLNKRRRNRVDFPAKYFTSPHELA